MNRDIFKNVFIFEVANNHEGSVSHGTQIIEAMGKIAHKHDIRGAVKFQYRDLDSFIHPEFKNRTDVNHIPRFFKARLAEADFRKLNQAVAENGLLKVVTPFDEVSVQQCLEHEVDILKIASCSAGDWPLLETVAQTGKPVIISTGGLSIYEIDNIVSFFTHKNVNFALMHCCAVYPTPNALVQLNFLEKMKRRYPDIPVGYSGHEDPDNYDVVKVAISKGASLLERHVGIATERAKLNKYSMDPEQTDMWVASALIAQEICGTRHFQDHKKIPDEEINSLLSLKRGVYAARDIREGEKITREDIFFAMPCNQNQLNSGDFGRYRANYIATRNYRRHEAVAESAQPDLLNQVRGLIHDARGMLFEAQIALGNEYEIELSHHYGLEQFRSTGALIVNLINREYCKKLVVILPGQKHPSHQHKLKEETFQLLWGDLAVVLNEREINMKVGDKLLVERGSWHSFSSKQGAIFEEVSTTHFKGDSHYLDDSIRRLDPMERKTILDSW